MTELIGGLAQVRDGLTLIAFLSLVVLFPPDGGTSFETAMEIAPGLYRCAREDDTNGKLVKEAGDGSGTMRGNAGPRSSIYQLNWVAPSSGSYFLSTHAGHRVSCSSRLALHSPEVCEGDVWRMKTAKNLIIQSRGGRS